MERAKHWLFFFFHFPLSSFFTIFLSKTINSPKCTLLVYIFLVFGESSRPRTPRKYQLWRRWVVKIYTRTIMPLWTKQRLYYDFQKVSGHQTEELVVLVSYVITFDEHLLPPAASSTTLSFVLCNSLASHCSISLYLIFSLTILSYNYNVWIRHQNSILL